MRKNMVGIAAEEVVHGVVYVVEEYVVTKQAGCQGSRINKLGTAVVSRQPANHDPPFGRNHAASDRLPMT